MKTTFLNQLVRKRQGMTGMATILLLVSIAYFAAYIFIYSRYASDDSYIHLRIARNLAAHGLPYYNPNEAVSGSSSLFWMLVLGGLFKLTANVPMLLPFIALAFTTGSFLITAALLQERFTRNLSIGLAFLVTVIMLVNVSALLMETPAAIFFWLIAVWLWRKKSFGWMGFFSGAAFLTRYEFALWSIIAFIMIKERNGMLRYAKGIAPPVIFYIAFNLYFFGSLIPQTVLAKSKIYTLSINQFLTIFHSSTGNFLIASIAILVVGFLVFKQKNESWIQGITLFPILLLGLYCGRKVMMFDWYLPNVLFPLALAFLLVLKKKHSFLIIALVIGFPSLFTQGFAEGYGLVSGSPTFYRDYDTGRRVHQYLRIGADLSQRYPDSILMTSEIGGLGWGFPGKIIDAAGLISPECLKYHPMPVPEDRSGGYLGAIPPQAVRDLQPDLVVSMETFSEAVRRDLRQGELGNYTLMQSYPVLAPEENAASSTLWGSKLTQVFIRTTTARSR